MADGNNVIDKVQIEIEATAKGATKAFIELESRLSALQKVLNSVDTSTLEKAAKASRGISAFATGMNKTERDVVKSVDKIQQSLAGLQSYKNAALSGDSSSATSFERQAVRIQSALDVLTEKLKQAGQARPGLGVEPETLEAYREQALMLQEALAAAKAEVANMPKPDITPDPEPTENAISRIDKAVGLVGKSTIAIGKGIQNAFKKIKDAAHKISDALHKIKDAASKAGSVGFGKLLKYGFGIRSMYVLFRRLRKAVIESFGELQNSGAFFETTRANIESLKAALNTLKFQFGAAFEPIFNAVAPALETLINYLIAVMNVISAFTAKLMGKSTYSRAVANMGALSKATGGAAKAQKELNKQLQSFDELNNLTTNNNGGGGGGGGGGSTPGATYVEESVDNVLGDFGKTLADKIRAGDWEGVGTVISEKLQEVMESIPWDKVFKAASDFGTKFAQFLNGLISPELFKDLGSTIANAINAVFKGAGAFAKEFEFYDLGLSIGAGITEFFKTGKFNEWGTVAHDWIMGILDAGIGLIEGSEFDQITQSIGDFLEGLQVSDILSKLAQFGTTLGSAICDALKNAWNSATLKEKMGAVIIAGIALANLTGLTSMLTNLLTTAIANNPITVGQITILAATAVITFETATYGFAGVAKDLGDDELAKEYDNFSWSNFFQTIMNPEGGGIDWDTIGRAWNDMWDDYVEPLGEVLYNFGEKVKERFNKMGGWKAILTDIFTLNPVNITWDFASLFTNLPSIQELWNKGYEKQNEIVVSIKSKLEGVFQSIDDFTKFSETWNAFKTAWTNITASIKATLGGAIKKITDLDSWKTTFKGLADTWKDKTANFTSFVGGQIAKIADLDSWKARFTGLFNTWVDKAATFIANVGGAISRYTDLSTWKTTMSQLRTTWADKSSTLSAKVGGAIAKITDLNSWKDTMNALKTSWVGKTANFVATFAATAIDSWKQKIQEIRDLFTSKTATFTLKFKSTIDDVKGWINDSVIKPLNEKLHKVPFLSGVNIPRLATGGVITASMLANIGESGAEAVVPLENNLGWLRKMSNLMVNGIMDTDKFRYVTEPPTTNYTDNITSGSFDSDRDLMFEQNRLLEEQNRLLQQIAAKDTTISSRDVYTATYNEARNYYNRTGNSPFVF